MTNLTQTIRTRAAAANITIPALLKLAGVGNSNIWRWENRGLEPNAIVVGKIMDALDVADQMRAKRLAAMADKMEEM